MRGTWIIVAAAVGLIVGLLAGIALTSRLAQPHFHTSIVDNAVTNASVNLTALEHLRQGEIHPAANLLETRVDSAVVTLAVGFEDVPATAADKWALLRRIRDYRQVYPRDAYRPDDAPPPARADERVEAALQGLDDRAAAGG